MEDENLFLKIQELLGQFNGNYNFLDQQIDVELQMEYFEAAREVKGKTNADDIFLWGKALVSENVSIDDKKQLLVQLASIDQAEAFRMIEKYMENPMTELKDWGTLALHESKMVLEGALLEQNQIFISTGLGGRGTSLRYFIVFMVKENEELNELRQKIVEGELSFSLKKFHSILEEVTYYKTFLTVKTLIPIQSNIQDFLDETVTNCNQFGDFLLHNYLVTNVRELSHQDILDLISPSNESKLEDVENISKIDLTNFGSKS